MSSELLEQNWRLWVSYEGTRFCGWQKQPGLASIESTLQDAFFALIGERPIVTAAGRTDSGVHAHGQVVSCTIPNRFDADKIIMALSSQLPVEIAVWRADKMPPTFNAKRHSVGKCYIYTIHKGPVKDPFSHKTTLHLRQPLNIAAMQQAANQLVGEHDFESFRSLRCDAKHARRYLWMVKVAKTNDKLQIEVRGNAFCHNMIRIMVGTLIDVGAGRTSPDEIATILKKRDRSQAGKTAPPHGLSLVEVYYPDDLAKAGIPNDAIFPRFPVTKETWSF